MVPMVCGTYHDDGVYISTAKALAQGDGYCLINLPHSPPQTKYPFLFPAMLAVIWKLWPSFPENIAAMQWLTLSFAGLAIGLSYLYLVAWGYTSRSAAFLAGTLAATSPIYLSYGTLVLSEMPFAVFTLLAMLALEWYLADPFSSRWGQFFLGVLLAIPYLTRAIGIVFLPVSLALILWRRRPFFWVGLGVTIASLPWLLWSILAPQWDQNMVIAFYTNYLSWWSFVTGWGSWFIVLLVNFLLICLTLWLSGLAWLAAIDLSRVFYLGLILLGLLPFVTIVRRLRQSPVLPSFLLSYLCLTLIWPWPPNRFLIPILPLLLAFLFDGVRIFLAKWPPLTRSLFPTLILGAFLVYSNLLTVNHYCQEFRKIHPQVIKFKGNYPPWTAYQEVFAWVSRNTRPTEIIAYGWDSMLYLYTGRQAFRPFVMQPLGLFYSGETTSGGIPELKKFLEIYQASYLIQTPLPGFAEEKPFADLLKEVQERHPGWLQPVFQGQDGRFNIFRIQPAEAPRN
jgi:hypothetical protein